MTGSALSHAPAGQRRKVVSEEEYTSTLSDIVERDYFPDLASLRQRAALLDRRAVGDFRGAVEIRRAARRLQRHEEELALREEQEEREGKERRRRVPRPLHRETVTGFHARVLSEDNHHFDETQKEERRAHKTHLEKAFQISSSSSVPAITDGRELGNETPLLASDQFNPTLQRRNQLPTSKNKPEENSFFFVPSQYNASTEHSDTTTTTTKRLTNGQIAETDLMPPPARKRPKEEESSLVEYIPKHCLEKRIEPAQTRFPPKPVVPVAPSLDSADVSSAFTSTDYSTDATTDLDAPVPSLDVDRSRFAKRQKRQQETLVAMTPKIEPGRGSEPESPITTWGTVSDTPLVLSQPTDPAERHFSMPAESGEEKAARKAEATLAARVKAAKPKKPKQRRTPLLDRGVGNLTPAARSLWDSSKRLSSVRSGSAFSSALRSSYTPKRRGSSTQSASRHGARVTPRIERTPGANPPAVAPNQSNKLSGNITDGLLHLPKS